MREIFYGVLNMSLTGGMIILGLILLRPLLKKLPKRLCYGLWLIPAVRLLCPFSVRSAVSLFNLFRPEQSPAGRLEYIPPPAEFVPATAPTTVSGVYMGGLETPAIKNLTFKEILPYVWAAVAVGVIIFNIISFIRIYFRVRGSREAGGYFICEKIGTPFVFGVLRPKIYLPAGVPEDDLKYILAHENAHIRRFDHIVKLLATLVLALHWFNPAVWAGIKLMGLDMELSCDEKAILSLSDGSEKGYAKALLHMSMRQNGLGGTVLGFGESGVGSRVKNALNMKKPTVLVGIAAVLAAGVLALIMLTNPLPKGEKLPNRVVGEDGAEFVSYKKAKISETAKDNIIFDCESEGDVRFCLIGSGATLEADGKYRVSGLGVGFIGADGAMRALPAENFEAVGGTVIDEKSASEFLRCYMFGGSPVVEIGVSGSDGRSRQARFYLFDGENLVGIKFGRNAEERAFAVLGEGYIVDEKSMTVTDMPGGTVYKFVDDLTSPMFLAEGMAESEPSEREAENKYRAIFRNLMKSDGTGYPEYFGGADVAGSELTVYLTDDGDEVMDVISSIIDITGVRFVRVKYSYNRLTEEREKICEKLKKTTDEAALRCVGADIEPATSSVRLYVKEAPEDVNDKEKYYEETLKALTDFENATALPTPCSDGGGYSDDELKILAVRYYNLTQPQYDAFSARVSPTESGERKIEVLDHAGAFLQSYTVDRLTSKGVTGSGKEIRLDFLKPSPPYSYPELSALALDYYLANGGEDRAVTVCCHVNDKKIEIVDVLKGEVLQRYAVNPSTGKGLDLNGMPVDFTLRAGAVDLSEKGVGYTPEQLRILAENYYKTNISGDENIYSEEQTPGESGFGTAVFVKNETGEELWRCIVSGMTGAGYDGSGNEITLEEPESWREQPSAEILDALVNRYMDWERFTVGSGMKTDRGDCVVLGGTAYYRVVEPGFYNLKDLRGFLFGVFDSVTAEEMFKKYTENLRKWIIIDKKLYVCDSEYAVEWGISREYRAEVTKFGEGCVAAELIRSRDDGTEARVELDVVKREYGWRVRGSS